MPRYLQRQFARLLYDLRFRLASRSTGDIRSVGRLLAAHASDASTRLQEFLQQEELTGQIAIALLRGESDDPIEMIHTPTLKRIVADLEQVRTSREWLKETRYVVSDRFKGIGQGTPRVSTTATTESKGTVLSGTSPFVIRPDLVLRHAGSGNWSVLLRLKSFRPVAAESTELRSFLDRTRCRLNGASDWKPTGWLLSGDRKAALKRWPDEAKPLIEFERQNPFMAHLLKSDCRLEPGPIWLFRIGIDGIARQIASRTVRPGYDYIVAAMRDIQQRLPALASCALQCAGIRAFRLKVPVQISANTTARLRELGINVARSIRVWPAGLPGRGWDGDGSSEWLSTESPCFGIEPDHPLDALAFRLNGDSEQIIAIDPSGRPTFVQLPPLRAGIHMLTVEAHRSAIMDQIASTPPPKGFMRLAVREPEPWTPGVASHPGLIITTDPYDPNLDAFWRNEVALSVNGPEDFSVTLDVSLYAADGRKILSETVGPPLSLPITPDTWHRVFDHFLRDETRAWKYLDAASCTLEIKGGSLGRCTLGFDHDPSPLRWTLRSRRHQTIVRLVDDTGKHDTAPDIRFYSIERPLDAVASDPEIARVDRSVEAPGGLFLARHPPYVDTAVVSAPLPGAGLKGLAVDPLVEVSNTLPGRLDALRLLRLWHDARQAGFLAGLRQRQVIHSIISAVFGSMAGESWATAEEAFTERPMSRDVLRLLEARVDRRGHFGRALCQHTLPSNSDSQIASSFAADAAVTGVSRDRDLCRFALRFATTPLDVLSGPDLDARIAQLTENPALLRGARLVALLREQPGSGANTPLSARSRR